MAREKKGPEKGRQGGGPRGGGHGLGRPVEKAKDFKGTVRRLLGYLKNRRISLIIIIVLTVFATMFTIVGPKILGRATTKLFEGVYGKIMGIEGAAIDFAAIGQILLFLIGLYVVSALFNYIMQYVMASVAQETVYELREDVNHKLEKIPLKYYDSKTHGEILSRVTNDVDNIANTLQQSVTQLISAVITIIGVIIMMLTISPMLTLITLVTLPISIFITQFVAKKSQTYFVKQQRILGELNGHIEEMYTGQKIVKAFGKEQDSIDKFEEHNDELYEAGWKAQFISGVIMPMMQFVNNLGYVLVCVVGGILVTGAIVFNVGPVTITIAAIAVGDIQAFIQYSRQFGQPIVQTANIANLIQSTVASAERVFDILDEIEEIKDKEKAVTIEEVKGQVTFEHIKFGYVEGEPLMKDINIEVKPGQKVAIVGPTGAGKTTLVNLLMRFYEVWDGQIKVDGVKTTDMTRADLRKMFGMVLQDTWLFKGTIRENIAYGREDATEEEIVHAAKLARADHFIRTLPDGYDTILTEDANNISGGQRQLLTIARAILANPTMLILDEATSSVDTRTEVNIQKAMETLMKDRTSFVIAHRLSTIKDSDMILVMNHGDIIEYGNHDELIAADGFYADLYHSQFTTKFAS
jgi:ATP-binding cassette subfamily B protein